MMSRFFLSSILFVAGLLHLFRPDLFNAAIPFSHKNEINLLVGLLEIVLGLGLWLEKYKEQTSRLTALWFLLLTPIHLYVCINEIPMFGVSDPVFLWLRTFFQPVLYFWALSLQEKGWIMSQHWSHVVFLHYEVSSQQLQKLVPFPLDLYQGKAVVTIVPFVMSRIRFPFFMPIPGLSKLLELNLRTYVKVNGKPAVYFFTLDSNHLPAVLIARWFFALPYRWVKLSFSSSPEYIFKSADLSLRAKVGSEQTSTEFDLWATERYALFTKKGDRALVGVVEHAPWNFKKIDIIDLKDKFSHLLGSDLPLGQLLGSSYSEELNVKFKPFKSLEQKPV